MALEYCGKLIFQAPPAILKIPAVNNRIVIAIDGPSGAGKSSIARSLARRMGITYIDTGAMYRAIALWALRADVDINDPFRVERLAREARIEFGPAGEVLLNGEDVSAAVREPQVAA